MDRQDIPFVILICLGLGFTLGYLVQGKVPSPIAKDAWDIAAAIGTVGAVFVAVAFGIKTVTDARRQRKARGLLALVLLNSSLDSLRRDLEFMRERLLAYDDAALGNHAYHETIVFDPLRHHALSAMTVEVLDMISGLSDDVALHLGFATASLSSMAGELRPYVEPGVWTGLEPNTRISLIQRCAHVALEAGLSVGYSVQRADDLLKADKRRLLRLAHEIYTRKNLGPAIKLKDVLGDA
jgi:hypothetical protein